MGKLLGTRCAMLTAIIGPLLITACDGQEDHTSTTIAALGPQPDLVIGGRRFTWTKAVTFVKPPAESVIQSSGANLADANLTAEQLATAMRPRVMKGGNEYILAEPDVALASQILAGMTAPETSGQAPTASTGASSSDAGATATGATVQAAAAVPKALEAHPEYIIGNDDRTRVGCARMTYPSSAKGWYSTQCSATLIGPHTVAIAAHCVYSNGWFGYGTFSPGADTTDQPSCQLKFPFGQYTPTFIAVPGGWNSNEWNYDYAFMDFSPSNPGNVVGWMGTKVMSGAIATNFQDYPNDKPVPQYWQQSGTINCLFGSGGSSSCSNETPRLQHYFDIIPGASGGGFIYTATNQLFGIQSTQNSSCIFWSCSYWNEASHFTTTVYNFFHQFNWP